MLTSGRIERSIQLGCVDRELYKSFESDTIVGSIDLSVRTVIASPRPFLRRLLRLLLESQQQQLALLDGVTYVTAMLECRT